MAAPPDPAPSRRDEASGISVPRLAGWGVGLLIAFLALAGIAVLLADAHHVRAALGRLSVKQLALLMALSSCAFCLRTLRWQLYARAQRIRIPLLDNALIYISGYALGATPGRVGEVVRLLLLRRGFGLPYRRTAPLLIADRLNDVNTLALLMLVGASYVLKESTLIFVALALVVAINALLRFPAPLLRMVDGLFALSQRLFALSRRRYALSRRRYALSRRRHELSRRREQLTHWRYARVAAGLRRLLRRTQSTFSVNTQLLASLLSLAAWSFECASLFWILDALNTPIDLRAAIAIHATASLVGALSMLPGGFGGFEATCVALLLWQGIPVPEAVVATAVLRVTTFWYSLLLGTPVLAWAILRLRRNTPTATADRSA